MFELAYQQGVQSALEKIGIDLKGAREAYERLKEHIIKRQRYVRQPGEISMDPTWRFKPWVTDHADKKIYAKGDTAHAVAKSLTRPEDQEIFNRLLLLHEASERSSIMNRHGVQNWRGGHHDPSVLLHENNMLATLPPENIDVKRSLQWGRQRDQGLQALQEFLPAPFGEKRYNRHEIKAISEKVLKKYPPEMRSSK